MPTIRAQWRVLESAFDELNLWELPGRHVYYKSSGVTIAPDIPEEEIRAAVIAALCTGLVELWDQEREDRVAVKLEEGLALVASEREWNAQTALRQVALSITAHGEEASHAVFAEYRRTSPFLAAGAADPSVTAESDVDGEQR